MSIAEEIQNAPTVIPLSMGVSTLLNGVLGFAMVIALMFCMPSDISNTLNSDTYYPFMSMYTYAVGSVSGGTAMVSPLLDFISPRSSFLDHLEALILLNKLSLNKTLSYDMIISRYFEISTTNVCRPPSSSLPKLLPSSASLQRLRGCYGHLLEKMDYHFLNTLRG